MGIMVVFYETTNDVKYFHERHVRVSKSTDTTTCFYSWLIKSTVQWYMHAGRSKYISTAV